MLLLPCSLEARHVDGLPPSSVAALLSHTGTREPGFSEQYERDYNIFHPINQYRADNPLSPINAYDPKNPLNPISQYDPGHPPNPSNQFNPSNPYNSLNQYHPKNPLNPMNR